MKPHLKSVVLLFSLALVSESPAQTQPAAETPPVDAKSVSYALGVNMGMNLSNTMRFLGVTNIDAEILTGALKEVLAKQTPRMTQREAIAITNNWNTTMRRDVAVRNLAAGKAYIEKFAKEPGVKELTNGIYYRVVKEGDGPRPTLDDTVTVHYRGKLVDGEDFDSSYSRNQPWDTQVRRVIRGWQLTLPMIKVGSKWDFVIPSELAYGERGTGAAVPPNSILIYEFEMLAIKPPATPATGTVTNAPSGR